MTAQPTPDIQAALQLLADSGMAQGDLLDALRRTRTGERPVAPNGRPMPSVAEYLPTIEASIKETSYYATWRPHLRALEAAHGEDLLSFPNADDCRALVDAAGVAARKHRPNSRNGGKGAQENCLNLLRFVFNRAVDAGYRPDNPASRLKRPARRKNARRHLEPDEIRQIFHVAVTGGNDPELDALILRTALETGCRREGLLNLTIGDIDRQWCRIQLDEKFDAKRWVPVSGELIDALVDHAHSRGATAPTDHVLRYLPRGDATVGAPLSRRRMNTLFERIQSALPWAAQEGISLHYLRHTAGTAIDRISGQAVAAAFLGHEHPQTTTLTYTRAIAREVCDAVSVYTGILHPLADPARVEALRRAHGPLA